MSAAVRSKAWFRLVGLQVRIPPGGMDVSWWVLCVVSGLWVGPITRPEESYWLRVSLSVISATMTLYTISKWNEVGILRKKYKTDLCNFIIPTEPFWPTFIIIIIIITFKLRTAAFKTYCAIWIRCSNFRHQASLRVSPGESTQRRKVELWAGNVR